MTNDNSNNSIELKLINGWLGLKFNDVTVQFFSDSEIYVLSDNGVKIKPAIPVDMRKPAIFVDITEDFSSATVRGTTVRNENGKIVIYTDKEVTLKPVPPSQGVRNCF